MVYGLLKYYYPALSTANNKQLVDYDDNLSTEEPL